MLPAKRRILCVDDDEDTCFMLAHLLEQENYVVETVTTVEAALALARNESFNLYILDKWFLKGAGVALCRKIREFDRYTPVIFYSGAAFDSDREEALYAGAQAFVAKPYIDELLLTVHRLLSDRHEAQQSSAN